MDRILLNEHDANQGAQSRGEFLGMTGNSGWYLLGSVGASLLIVILCWGMLGVSLLLCLSVGVILCGLSVAYVFTLKNNRPAHYDSDFFESALIEAGMMEMSFGPRARRIANPFTADALATVSFTGAAALAATRSETTRASHSAPSVRSETPREAPTRESAAKRTVRDLEPVVPLAAYEHVREELDLAEEMLEDAMTDRAEVNS
jgi:hypothetical protein